MDCYKLNFTISSPGNSTEFVEFSSNGRYLAVGDRNSLYILDRLTGFHPTISTIAPAKPTALVWESPKTFYVGLSDGRFIHYQIDLRGKRLVKGYTNNRFRGGIPITAIALDMESETLVLSLGPEVFAFRRVRATSEFNFAGNISNRFELKKAPGERVAPVPRSICFTPNNKLVVAFDQQHIASIVLEFDRDSRLHSSFQTAKIDYSGLPLLKAITSASDEEIHRITRFWVYGSGSQMDGNGSQTDSDVFPFLFINGGAATLSGSMLGAAIVRDVITQREIQLLAHTAVAGRRVSVIAYHISDDKYSIATADRGTNATIKIWTARSSPSNPRGQPRRGFFGYAIATLAVAFIVAGLSKIERFPDADEVLKFCLQTALIFVRVCIKIGYLVLDAAEDAVLDAEDTLE